MSVAMEEGPRRHRITVDEFYRMAEAGLFAPDARVELIDGEIIEMPPIGDRHHAGVDRLNRLFIFAVGERAIVRCQGSVQLGDLSSPQPDFVLLTERENFYADRRAQAHDTLLAVEVSDSSLHYELKTKMALYARHAIHEYWVLDVQGSDVHRLHVFRNPAGNVYEEKLSIEKGPAVLPIPRLAGVTVDLSSLFR